MSQKKETLSFESPGPGVWQLDVSHLARPITRNLQEWFCEYYEHGQSLVMKRYGMPLKTIGARSIEGFLYIQPIPLGGPPGGKAPPAFVLKLLAYLMPTFRRCRKKAEAALKARAWREDTRRWDEEVWPALRARFESLQAVDLGALDDAGLVAHLDLATRAHQDSMVAHFDTSGATMLPTGLLLLAIGEDRDIDSVDILATIGGQAPTVVEDTRQLNALRAQIADQDPASLDGEPAAVIEALRQRDDDLGAAARQWLERVESRQIWAGDYYLPHGGGASAAAGGAAAQAGRARANQRRAGRGNRPVASTAAQGGSSGIRQAARRGTVYSPPAGRALCGERRLGLRDRAPGAARGGTSLA